MSTVSKEQRRFAQALEGIWKVEVGEDWPLKKVHFGDPGPGIAATVQYKDALRGDLVIITPGSVKAMLWKALHELGHRAHAGHDTEQACDQYADLAWDVWLGPVEAYCATGDPTQINDILRTEQQVKAQVKADLAQRKQADQARRFAQKCKTHGVKAIRWAPNRCAPWIEWGQPAAKSTMLEVMAWVEEQIKRLGLLGDPDSEKLAFVRSVLARRRRYTDFVNDLLGEGLLPSPA